MERQTCRARRASGFIMVAAADWSDSYKMAVLVLGGLVVLIVAYQHFFRQREESWVAGMRSTILKGTVSSHRSEFWCNVVKSQ